jgi:predicted RNase H-like HicB family nuclease
MNKLIKLLKSYSKKEWDFDDYPVEIYSNENAGEDKVKFGARIVNWSVMVGHGETKQRALENLKESFKLFKDNNELPRPGTKVPLRFALRQEIEDYEELAVDFFDKILKLNYYDCFVSDQSSLVDFESLDGDDKRKEFKIRTIKRIKEIYGANITDTYDKYLVDVFNKIKSKE